MMHLMKDTINTPGVSSLSFCIDLPTRLEALIQVQLEVLAITDSFWARKEEVEGSSAI